MTIEHFFPVWYGSSALALLLSSKCLYVSHCVYMSLGACVISKDCFHASLCVSSMCRCHVLSCVSLMLSPVRWRAPVVCMLSYMPVLMRASVGLVFVLSTSLWAPLWGTAIVSTSLRVCAGKSSHTNERVDLPQKQRQQ